MGLVVELSQEVGKVRACAALGLPRASLYRSSRARSGEARPRPSPPRTLRPEERQLVLETMNSQEFLDKAPAEVYATLLDRRQYLCSIRTMYRILDENGEVRERRDQLRHPAYKKPELLATGPNQVWSWDITKLRGPQKWTYYYLYVILDIFSRYPVGWMLAERESAVLAERLIEETQEKQGIKPGELTVHMDRGAPMTAKSFALLLADLGIAKSYSRPHVSDDNPFIEAHFKTVKYMPDFPEEFGSVQDARAYCRRFFQWYAMEHHHWGIALLTPYQVHYGLGELVTTQRQEVLTQAYAKHPDRFVRKPPRALSLPTAVWINSPSPKKEQNQPATNSVPQRDPPGSPRNDDLGSTRPVPPPETAPLATPPEHTTGAISDPETLAHLPDQSSPEPAEPTRHLPAKPTLVKPAAGRSRPRRSAAALQ
jgi:putative transposase